MNPAQDAKHLMNLLRLDGKVAMVTGGCQNFGLEIATGLAELVARREVTPDENKSLATIAKDCEPIFERGEKRLTLVTPHDRHIG